MTLLLTGISNENEFYTNYYLSEVIENDLKEVSNRWKEEFGDKEEKAPPEKLRSLANEYFQFRSAVSKEGDTAIRLSLQREFTGLLLEVLGYKQQLHDRILEDEQIIPLLCEISKANGEPLLWILESFSEEQPGEESYDPFESEFHSDQFQSDSDAVKCLANVSLESVIAKNIYSQEEPPRWLMLVSESQILLLDRSKWNDQRLLRFDLEEIFARREYNTLTAMCALLYKDSIVGGQEQSLLDTLDEKSHKHAQSVTEDLKFALQKCIEIIGNEAIHYMRSTSKERIYDTELAKKLSIECLRFMYRLLFVLYIESREELGYAPMKSDEYLSGYSFESLRDLEVVELASEEAREGFFIHDSIRLLFEAIYKGYPESSTGVSPQQLSISLDSRDAVEVIEDKVQSHGFELPPLRSHLFDPSKTPTLNRVRMRNSELLKVLKLMSLSKSKGNKHRSGRISYAQLGINQLGAVYEALLCFHGFFAETDLYEVQPAPKKGGRKEQAEDDDSDFENDDEQETKSSSKKSKKGKDIGSTRSELEIAYLVPLEELDKYSMDERVFDEHGKQKKYEKGRFVYRLAGRDRQKSASYYTPEVLTKCLVKYSLKELLKEKTADEILKITVCEPAMGSAAFLNECVNQLAEAYLERKQEELGENIPHEQYPLEKQRVKMYLADRNVFGVDLNPVAVELAEVSLWLNSIYKGAFIPWFGMQLISGNSLVGARRQVYSSELLTQRKRGATMWYETEPGRITPGDEREPESIYHFLLADPGMCKYDDKVVKTLAKDEIKAVDTWRKEFTAAYKSSEVLTLISLSARIDELWKQHTDHLRHVRLSTTDPLSVFGAIESESADSELTSTEHKDSVYRQEGLAPDEISSSAYRVLKLVMDYWCALWYWPILESSQLPSRADFLSDVRGLLSVIDGSEAGGGSKLDDLLAENPRLQIVTDLSTRYRFHHWELEYADVFIDNGGFDLVIGNPPWIKLEWQEGGVLGDHDPIFVVKKISAPDTAKLRKETLEKSGMLANYLEAYEESASAQSFLNSFQNYPLLRGIQSNSFKCFLPQGWMVTNPRGFISFLHPGGVYDDPKGGKLRRALYERLRYYFQVHNELKFFPIGNRERFGLNIYSNRKTDEFIVLNNIFHPKTIDSCFEHSGEGTVPGIKDEDNKWEISGHKERIIIVDDDTRAMFANLYDTSVTPPEEARLPALHSKSTVNVLHQFLKQPQRLADIEADMVVTEFWHETSAQKDGTIRRETCFVDSIEEFVYSGPHFHIGNPFFKTPKRVCNSHKAYDVVDLSNIPADYLPRTNYIPECSKVEYRRRITDAWNNAKVTDYYRVIARKMLSPSMERTLISSIIPHFAAHTNGGISITVKDETLLVPIAAQFYSIVFDFFIKSTGKSNLYRETIESLPLLSNSEFVLAATPRVLLLNCLTNHFDSLWNRTFRKSFNEDSWTNSDVCRLLGNPFSSMGCDWSPSAVLKSDLGRRQALLELDVLVGLFYGLKLEEFLDIYRIQFPVMRQYDRETYFDQFGRIVFTTSKSLPGIGLDRKTWEEVRYMESGVIEKTIEDDTLAAGPCKRSICYKAPFFLMDRDRDYQVAWNELSSRLGFGKSQIRNSEKMSSII